MNIHDLRPNPGAKKGPKRLGRGTGSGLGKTSGKGHKGALARSGGGKAPGFEGGQMPLMRRLPKRGFYNPFSIEYATVNVEALNAFEDGAVITPESLKEAGVIRKMMDGLKVLADGDITKKLTVRAHKFSASAKEKIEKAGGKAELIVVESKYIGENGKNTKKPGRKAEVK